MRMFPVHDTADRSRCAFASHGGGFMGFGIDNDLKPTGPQPGRTSAVTEIRK